MAHVAVAIRPGLLGAVALLAISLAPWRVVMSPSPPPAVAIEQLAEPSGGRSLSMELREPSGIPNTFHSWSHPDMQAWPRGMVMGVPAIDHGIVLRRATLFDRWLSVFLAPLRSSDT